MLKAAPLLNALSAGADREASRVARGRSLLYGIVLLYSTFSASPVLGAESRFKALATDSLVPGLQIVTMLDTAQGACYLIFLTESDSPRERHFTAQQSDVDRATTWRDRRLAELSQAYDQAFYAVYPGTPPINVLRFSWEAEKVQSEYERIVRENELAWFEEQLERIALLPRIAVSGPAPCGGESSLHHSR
jgi:hypothetical protein